MGLDHTALSDLLVKAVEVLGGRALAWKFCWLADLATVRVGTFTTRSTCFSSDHLSNFFEEFQDKDSQLFTPNELSFDFSMCSSGKRKRESSPLYDSFNSSWVRLVVTPLEQTLIYLFF